MFYMFIDMMFYERGDVKELAKNVVECASTIPLYPLVIQIIGCML
jgi:hypothetical protein